MHPNPSFRATPEARALALVRERGFGTLAVAAEDGAPLLSHVPVLLSPDGAWLEMHLVRSNPILRRLPAPAVVAVQGPDGYVSPDWYGADDQVPTWNYVAVHLRGPLERMPQEGMRALLDRQSAAYEERLEGKRPWTADKMTPEVLERMMRQIVPCRMAVEDVQSTVKLGQNKPEPVRLAAAARMEEGLGQELGALAAMMREGSA